MAHRINRGRRGVWAGVLLMCGQFERVCILLLFLSSFCTKWCWDRLLLLCGNTKKQRLKVFTWHLRWLIMVSFASPLALRLQTWHPVCNVTLPKLIIILTLTLPYPSSVPLPQISTCCKFIHHNLAIRPSIRQDWTRKRLYYAIIVYKLHNNRIVKPLSRPSYTIIA